MSVTDTRIITASDELQVVEFVTTEKAIVQVTLPPIPDRKGNVDGPVKRANGIIAALAAAIAAAPKGFDPDEVRNDTLDEGLDESFPASDPVAATIPPRHANHKNG